MNFTGATGATVIRGARWPLLANLEFDRISTGVTTLTVALLVAAVAPLFAIEIPSMLDYTNHLARMYLLAGPPNPAYEAHWGLYPDLAMDFVVPALARTMSVPTAAKVFLGASQVLVVSGAVALELIVKGRHRLGGLGALLVLFSLPFAWGQLNFMFGMGLAVWGIGLWIGLRDRPAGIRWTAHAAVVAVLFITHFFDLGVYGLAIGLYELSRLRGSPKIVPMAKLAALMASPVLVALGIMSLAGDGPKPAGVDWNFFLKLYWPTAFLNVYDLPLSMLTAGVLLALVLAMAATRQLTLTREGAWIAGGLAAAYVVFPRQLLGSQHLDVRLLAAAALILPAFMRTSLRSAAWRLAPLAAVVAIIALNGTATVRAWFDFQRDYEEFHASFAQLAPGSAVLIGRQDDAISDDQPLFYAATLAAPFAGVFVSSLYAEPGMQPIQPRAKYRALAVKEERECMPPRLAMLRAAAKEGASAATQANIVSWPTRYQYLYLVGRHGRNPLPETLTELAAGRRFRLYRIGRPS